METIPYKHPSTLLAGARTLAAYVNAWPDSLTFDDKAFAASERFSSLSLSDVSGFITEDLWAASGASTGLYRPLLLVTIAMDAYFYGGWAAGYHLSNILLHLLVTLLVFGFIRHLLLVSGGQSPLSDHIAILAAAVFGVHPIHTEVVNSIFNRSGMLVSLGVVGGLWWFLRNLETQPLKAWGGATIYLLVLFSKESGAILPALARRHAVDFYTRHLAHSFAKKSSGPLAVSPTGHLYRHAPPMRWMCPSWLMRWTCPH